MSYHVSRLKIKFSVWGSLKQLFLRKAQLCIDLFLVVSSSVQIEFFEEHFLERDAYTTDICLFFLSSFFRLPSGYPFQIAHLCKNRDNSLKIRSPVIPCWTFRPHCLRSEKLEADRKSSRYSGGDSRSQLSERSDRSFCQIWRTECRHCSADKGKIQGKKIKNESQDTREH